MKSVTLHNSLTRKKENFQPHDASKVTVYTCGPTVYDYQHIGNLRTATLMDVTVRSLKFLGYGVTSIMNITDVEDKIENRAAQLNVSVDEITKKYEQIYYDCLSKLNIDADFYPHASEHVKEQIEIIEELEKKEFTYTTDYGVYFDISKDKDYGKLGNTFKSDKSQSRINNTEQKKNPEDFVLWRIPKEGEHRQKLWDSPWGRGYPGWHIECSAMSMKCLSSATFDGGQFHPENFTTIDIHLGGEDLKEVHHENEIAQSESATGKPFVKYWMHGAMLNTGNEKMSKSLGNFLTLKEVLDKGINPLALRLFYFSAHYRKELTFTWDALEGFQTSLNRLVKDIHSLLTVEKMNIKFSTGGKVTALDYEDNPSAFNDFKNAFSDALQDDLNMPQAVSVLWSVLAAKEMNNKQKISLITEFDKVLGLNLIENAQNISSQDKEELPEDVKKLLAERDQARSQKNWKASDEIREHLVKMGYDVLDTSSGTSIYKS